MHTPVLIAGFLLMAFGWFGSNTGWGRRAFPIKTAVIPVGALILGSIVFARGLWLFVRR